MLKVAKFCNGSLALAAALSMIAGAWSTDAGMTIAGILGIALAACIGTEIHEC